MNTLEMNIFEIPSHPSADIFPMLEDDELDELAADIKANGLLMPLIVGELDGQPVLVDGRNRREACKRVGVIPRYTLLSDGEDLSARSISENVHRRHLTKGQRAMIVAKVIGLGYGKGKLQICNFDDDNPKTAKSRLSRARTILNHAPDLGDSG